MGCQLYNLIGVAVGRLSWAQETYEYIKPPFQIPFQGNPQDILNINRQSLFLRTKGEVLVSETTKFVSPI